MSEHVIRHAEVGPDGELVARIEQLKVIGATVVVGEVLLGDEHMLIEMKHRLRRTLLQRVAKSGRLVVGDLQVEQAEDWAHGGLMLRMTARTRQSDQGIWPEVWAAYREDGWE